MNYGFFDPSIAGNIALGVSIALSFLLSLHIYFVNTNTSSLEHTDLTSNFNPYRLSKDNNSQLMGRSFLNKLNPFSMPEPEYKNEKNEMYCDGLVYPLN